MNTHYVNGREWGNTHAMDTHEERAESALTTTWGWSDADKKAFAKGAASCLPQSRSRRGDIARVSR